jgi:hypothetical protein
MRYLSVILAVLVVGCSSQSPGSTSSASSSPTGPTGTFPLIHASAVNGVNCQPGVNVAQFAADQLGKVTITNSSPCTNDYTYILWLQKGDNQINVAQASKRLAPGEVGVITVGLPYACGARYARNVFFGIATVPGQNPYTFSDLNNAVVYAPGVYWDEPTCSPLSPPPALTMTCPSNQSVNASGPVAVTLSSPTVSGGLTPIALSSSPASGSIFPVGTTSVAWTATDAAAQKASCVYTVTIVDPPPSSYDFVGIVSELGGTCPDVGFVAAPYRVFVDWATVFTPASCQSLTNGMTVHVIGETRYVGIVSATSITVVSPPRGD